MDFLPEEFEEILNIFRGETEEIIQKLNNNLLQLENSPNNKDLIVYLFRDAHSLKGAARMIGFNNIQRLAHKAEDVLGLAKENKIVINREISDALYKAMDLLSDLIQESVKLKKEYYTDDIQKIIDYIDELTAKYQGQSVEESKNITQNEQNKEITTNPKTQNQDFLKTTITINALLSEAYLLLKNMQGEEGSSYIETFCDVIKQLDEKFEETNFYEIKNEIKNIFAKVDFVIKSSNLMTDDEIKDIDNKLTNTVNFLNKIYEDLGIEKIDVKEKVSQKIQQDKDNAKDKQNKNQTSAHSDTLNNLAEKIEFLKDGFNKFESDLSQVPQLYDEIKCLVEITNKKEIKQICDKIMEILAIVKKGKTLPDKEIITILKQSLLSVEKLTLETKEEQDDVTLVLQRLDIIKQMMDLNSSVNPLSNLSSTLDESSLPVKKAQDFFNSFETTSIRTLRVDSKKLDRLVSQMGELIIGRIKHKKNISELENILSDLTEWRNFNHKSQSFIKYYDRKYINSEDAVDYSTLSVFSKQIFSIFQENSSKIIKLNNRILNLQKSLDEEDTKLNTIVTQLESMIKNIRVLPLATIFHMFPRMIRDISKDTGKDIELLISGSETSADKKVIEEIKAPLMHIIRNSIDHGIETPQERIAAGKSPKGKIYLIAKSMQNKIIIEIHDDGRGIDLQKIVNRALEKNMITQKEAQYLSAEQIMNIIFWPGFSTEQVVTELSGRGVGLDIVQTKISQLNGTVKVFSVPNQGTKITIELPISMSTLKAFIVECSQQFFAMPMTSIKNVMWIKEEDIYLRNDTKSIIIEGKTVNLFYLSELMKLPLSEESSKSNKKTVILIEVENSLMGIIVDRILGDQNILQKKLDPPIMKLKNISGITTLANGDVCLILNLPELYKSTYTPVEKPLIPVPSYKLRARENKDYKILIVDDSITTRELLKNILIHWGYSFEMVKNPKEAFEILYKENFDLILSDMEMPEMDGSMFIKELKNTPKFKDIPVVLITSYDTERLAKDIPDIDAFIKKSNFNQDYLLDVIEKLLKYE